MEVTINLPLYARYCYEDRGFSKEIEDNRKLLILHNFYKVAYISIGQSSTEIKLERYNESFNSVYFDFYLQEKYEDILRFVEIDIYKSGIFSNYGKNLRKLIHFKGE